ncbi:MAG: ADP-ribosylglycohydrolase family protein [Myxococcota bacterium]
MLALDGLSVGDAFGQKFFITPEKAISVARHRWLPVAPWRFTDDTVMALSVVESLVRFGEVREDELADAFARRWAEDKGRGYGPGAFRILEAIRMGTPWRLAARSAFNGSGSMGNGAAMRVAPVGAYFADDFAVVVEEARKSARVTHAHPDGIAGAIAIAVATAASWQLRGQSDRAARIFAEVLRWTPASDTAEGVARAAQIPLTEPVDDVAERLGAGHQVLSSDTVPFCIWSACRNLESFEDAMWNTVAALGDRDTTCAIVGGIVAVSVGARGMPEKWIAAREPLPTLE